MSMHDSKNRVPREITYQVGRKRGKMIYSDQGKLTSHQTNSILNHPLVHWMERWMWKDVPLFPGKSLYYVLWLLPVVSCTATLWLISKLMLIK
jgi:hypothetical protein